MVDRRRNFLKFHLLLKQVCKMCIRDRYILAMTSLADSRDGFVRLMDALTKIDERLQKISFSKEKKTNYSESVLTCPEVEMLPVQAVNALAATKSVNEAEGFVSAEYGICLLYTSRCV